MWSWKIETIKHCFNLFHFEKVQVAQDEHYYSAEF